MASSISSGLINRRFCDQYWSTPLPVADDKYRGRRLAVFIQHPEYRPARWQAVERDDQRALCLVKGEGGLPPGRQEASQIVQGLNDTLYLGHQRLCIDFMTN